MSLYVPAGRELVAHLERTGGPDEPSGPRREHVEGLILELQERGRTPSGVSLVYRSLQQLMKYLGQEGELERSPMEHVTAPLIPELTTPVLSDDDLRALLATCAGRAFVDPRHRPATAVHRDGRTTRRGRRPDRRCRRAGHRHRAAVRQGTARTPGHPVT